jgi:predicted translation initiation factor SUI1
MARFRSLEDLKSLLTDEEKRAAEQEAAAAQPVRTGYDGRQQVLRIVLDTKKRRGKSVTVISGFQCSAPEIDDMAAKLKKSCGAGGTVTDRTIEIQGDHRPKVKAALEKMGFRVEAG